MKGPGRPRIRQWPSGRQYQKYYQARMSKLTAGIQWLLYRWKPADYRPARPLAIPEINQIAK